MNWSITTLALLLATGSFLAAACGGNEPAPSTRGQAAAIERPPAHPDYRGMEMPEGISAEDGKAHYDAQCASCHGEKGDGDTVMGKALRPPATDLTDPQIQAAMTDDYMYWRVSEGGAFPPFNSGMTPFKTTLDEQQRWQVIAYVRSLKR